MPGAVSLLSTSVAKTRTQAVWQPYYRFELEPCARPITPQPVLPSVTEGSRQVNNSDRCQGQDLGDRILTPCNSTVSGEVVPNSMEQLLQRRLHPMNDGENNATAPPVVGNSDTVNKSIYIDLQHLLVAEEEKRLKPGPNINTSSSSLSSGNGKPNVLKYTHKHHSCYSNRRSFERDNNRLSRRTAVVQPRELSLTREVVNLIPQQQPRYRSLDNTPASHKIHLQASSMIEFRSENHDADWLKSEKHDSYWPGPSSVREKPRNHYLNDRSHHTYYFANSRSKTSRFAESHDFYFETNSTSVKPRRQLTALLQPNGQTVNSANRRVHQTKVDNEKQTNPRNNNINNSDNNNCRVETSAPVNLLRDNSDDIFNNSVQFPSAACSDDEGDASHQRDKEHLIINDESLHRSAPNVVRGFLIDEIRSELRRDPMALRRIRSASPRGQGYGQGQQMYHRDVDGDLWCLLAAAGAEAGIIVNDETATATRLTDHVTGHVASFSSSSTAASESRSETPTKTITNSIQSHAVDNRNFTDKNGGPSVVQATFYEHQQKFGLDRLVHYNKNNVSMSARTSSARLRAQRQLTDDRRGENYEDKVVEHCSTDGCVPLDLDISKQSIVDYNDNTKAVASASADNKRKTQLETSTDGGQVDLAAGQGQCQSQLSSVTNCKPTSALFPLTTDIRSTLSFPCTVYFEYPGLDLAHSEVMASVMAALNTSSCSGTLAAHEGI